MLHSLPNSLNNRPNKSMKIAEASVVQATIDDFKAEARSCIERAIEQMDSISAIGNIFFISTEHRDAFILNAEISAALPLCISGKPVDYEYETMEPISDFAFTIEYTGTFSIFRGQLQYNDFDEWSDLRYLNEDMRETLEEQMSQVSGKTFH